MDILDQPQAQTTDGASPPNRNDEAEKLAQEQQMRRDMMATLLDSSARERLSRISLVSPARSKQIEDVLLRLAQSGQLRGQVSEPQLIGLLEQMEEAGGQKAAQKSTIIYQRRRDLDDDFDI